MPSRRFRYGIEHESALLRPDGTFADFTNTTFDELQDIVDALPEDPADLADLRVGDVGIKRKRWYVEGYERFDEHGTLLRCDPKGLEIRTRIHPSVEAAVAALRADQQRLDDEAAAPRACGVTAIGFNPVHSEYVVRAGVQRVGADAPAGLARGAHGAPAHGHLRPRPQPVVGRGRQARRAGRRRPQAHRAEPVPRAAVVLLAVPRRRAVGRAVGAHVRPHRAAARRCWRSSPRACRRCPPTRR